MKIEIHPEVRGAALSPVLTIDTGWLDAALSEGAISDDDWVAFMAFDGTPATERQIHCADLDTTEPGGLVEVGLDGWAYLESDWHPGVVTCHAWIEPTA